MAEHFDHSLSGRRLDLIAGYLFEHRSVLDGDQKSIYVPLARYPTKASTGVWLLSASEQAIADINEFLVIYLCHIPSPFAGAAPKRTLGALQRHRRAALTFSFRASSPTAPTTTFEPTT